MIKNYLKIALRNMLKNKSYVIINTFGLGIALACCITSYILVAYNIEFDDFYDDAKTSNIFRIHTHVTYGGANKGEIVGAPMPIGPAAVKDIAGVSRFVRYARLGANVSYGQNAFGEGLSFADSTLFDMFDFPLVSGNHQAFKDLNSIFINEKLATKYFGDEDPIGQVLDITFTHDVTKKVVVGGVIDKIPDNSSLYFQALIRFEHFEEIRGLEQEPWRDWMVPAILVELSNPENNDQLEPLFDRYIPIRNEARTDQTMDKITLEPFNEKISSGNIDSRHMARPISIEPLIIFISLALMIMLIACFNLTNTSIAIASRRLKEIGVRKSVGARPMQIMLQFLLETCLTLILSVIVGLALSNIIVPEFTAMWGLPYGLKDLNSLNLVITLVIIVFIASMLAGIYPALFSSRLNMVSLLKGSVKVKGTNGLTRVLLVMQFAISVIVLIGGVIFTQNTIFQEGIQFGYEKNRLLSISIQNEKEFLAMEAKANASPDIQEVAVTDHHLGYDNYPNPVLYNGEEFTVRHIGVGKNYFQTVGFNFIEGGPFDANRSDDFENAVIVSRQLLKELNIEGDPIGQELEVEDKRRRIVGVVEDFLDNISRAKDPEAFVFYAANHETYKLMIIKTDPEKIAAVDDYLEGEWKELYPSKPYNSQFQEEVVLEGARDTNKNLKKIFLFLTVLGGLLSASGIFALTKLNIAKRTKEIGIRKALGASIQNIVFLLNKEFLVILALAALIGGLGGFYATSWLLDIIYAFHVPVTLPPAVLSGLVIFTIGIITTSVTIFFAAKANPVETLRDE